MDYSQWHTPKSIMLILEVRAHFSKVRHMCCLYWISCQTHQQAETDNRAMNGQRHKMIPTISVCPGNEASSHNNLTTYALRRTINSKHAWCAIVSCVLLFSKQIRHFFSTYNYGYKCLLGIPIPTFPQLTKKWTGCNLIWTLLTQQSSHRKVGTWLV